MAGRFMVQWKICSQKVGAINNKLGAKGKRKKIKSGFVCLWGVGLVWFIFCEMTRYMAGWKGCRAISPAAPSSPIFPPQLLSSPRGLVPQPSLPTCCAGAPWSCWLGVPPRPAPASSSSYNRAFCSPGGPVPSPSRRLQPPPCLAALPSPVPAALKQPGLHFLP